MPEVVNYRFRLRRALKATWAAINDVLFDGEIGWARDTGELKVGDGTTGWNGLPYLERGIHLDRLGDVDAAAKSNGRVIAWDAGAQRHKYVDPAGSGGGGGASPFPDSVIYWLALRHRGGAEGANTYYANPVVAGVGLGGAMSTAGGVTFSELVNGLRGARFGGVTNYAFPQACRLFDNTIIAVLKTPTAAEWGAVGANNICVGSANGSPQLRLVKSGTDGAYVDVVRNQQAVIVNDSGYAPIPAGTVICITVLVAANNAITIRRDGVQTAAGTGAAFSQPLTVWGAKNSAEQTLAPLLEFVLFDRVLAGADLTDAEDYLMGVWGIS